jgi:ATP/maltotriose-dependent transcriptional regulator MalT/DNA-binding SARP family transcriptional activator
MPEDQVASEQSAGIASNVTASAKPSPTPRSDPAAHPSGLAIIASKINPAMPVSSVLTRPRLVGWFEQQAQARLMLVSAEAGYGKSTLLSDFALQTPDRCVWFRMETSDGDWITFLSYMVAAFREISPGFGRSTEALLRHVAALGSSREIVLAQFLADLCSMDTGRVAVILDDYHYVEESGDVRMILSRMLERAPEHMYFILGGRGRPNLTLGRLLAQGRVAELTIDDLRFTRSEINELFSAAYRQPLDDEACRIVAERTEGWAASLRLVSASIAVSRPNEVAAFIDALSGAEVPIYDFLAEEVLTRLSERTQRILIHASLIDRVRPELVVAALSVNADPPPAEAVDRALSDAQELGLLSGRGEITGGGRIHPLFREFLEVHLDRDTTDEQVRAMHHAIATEAEPSDWLVATKHFALAQEPEQAMRVLGSAASAALGTGAWGAAVEIIDLMPDTPPPPAVKVIQARALVSDGYPDEAFGLLQGIDRDGLDPEEQGLVGLTCAAIHHINGEGDDLCTEVEAVARNVDVPSPLHEVAMSWRQLLRANTGGCITDAVQMLQRLAVGQRQSGLHYFAGVTLHNTANAELARGNYMQARDLAGEAMTYLAQTDDGAGIVASTRSISATATAELGDFEEGLRAASAAATEPAATADAIAEAAYMHAVCGRTGKAKSLLAKFERGDARWSQELESQAQGCYANIALHVSTGHLSSARTAVDALQRIEDPDIDAQSRLSVLVASLASMDGSPEAPGLARAALETAASQNAWRWMARARILEAVACRDGDNLALWISEAETDSALAVLELADVVASAIGSLAPIPDALERSILREPARWIPALSRQVRGERSGDAGAAASLVARFGTAADAEVLRSYERAPRGKTRRRGLATKLIRRVSPTVRVHDLGLSSYEVGSRLVTMTETRRKSAALLLYLVSRPGLAATREQVMDGLWPDQSPKSALNSLHQTLFFLRRDIEPWYEDGSTADYVRMESDVVFLDQELFQVDSVAFLRQASEILATGTALSRGPEMLRLYKGEFAPEFEYEAWAEDWRTHLHGVFLHLAHSTSTALTHQRRFSDAVDVLTPVAGLDPMAFELRMTLVACLATIGSTDAAQAHYRSLAAAHERDLGIPARPYEDAIEDFL